MCHKDHVNWFWTSRFLETNMIYQWHFNNCCDTKAFRDCFLQIFYSWWLFNVSMEIFKAIWSYVHIMHKGTIPGLGLSQKVVMQFIHQMFPHFPHFHASIVYFHLFFILHCIVHTIFHVCPLSSNSPCGYCLLFVASATLNKIYLILS